MPAFFRLDGVSSSVLISNQSPVPAIAWLGELLHSDIDTEMLMQHQDTAHAFANLDARAPLNLFPQLSSGFMGPAALTGHRQGSACASNFSLVKAEQVRQTLTIELEDQNCKLELTIKIVLDADSDIATLTTSVRNAGSDDFSIDWLASATLPLPNHFTQCISQHGRWGLENQSVHRVIGPGRIDICNQHGRTGHEHGLSA